MSAIPCRECGELRKAYQSFSVDGWHQPPCYRCGDAGYLEPFRDDDEDAANSV